MTSAPTIGRSNVNIRPFLKWAGGKRRLVPILREHLPPSYGAYIEAFAGSAALLFGIQPSCALLADSNERLVRAHRAVRDDVETVIGLLSAYPNDERFFENMRQRSDAIDAASDAEVAAWFIYLNKTAYNGLYRVNRSNRFNVPFAHYESPTICDAATLRACSVALQGVSIEHASFEQTLGRAQAGDAVYLDPPYVPVTVTSFVDYTAEGFTGEQHCLLRDLAMEAKRNGVHVVISNSDTPVVRKLYSGPEFQLTPVAATRSIAANAARRGVVGELIISTYRPSVRRAVSRQSLEATGS